MSPLDCLNTFTRQFPDSKDVFRAMQQWHIKNNKKDGMFVPSVELHNLSQRLLIASINGILNGVTIVESLNNQQYDLVRFLWGCHLFGTWRNTMGVYRIDKDIAIDLLSSPIPIDTPAAIFRRLPEWCVYVEIPQNTLSLNSITIHGFWALFDIDKGHQVLNLVLNVDIDSRSAYECYQPLAFIVDEGVTVGEAIDTVASYTNELTDLQLVNEEKKIITHLLSMLLWLCADEPDISNIKGEPIPQFPPVMPPTRINKKTGAFIPPSQPIIYDIGKRLGGEVRQFKDQIERSDKMTARKRPHIRKGHWHGVWHGTGQNKQFKVYWQPAIFVNGS